MTTFHKVEIISDDPVGTEARVLVDGQEIRGVRAVDVSLDADSFTEVTVRLVAGSVYLDLMAQVDKIEPL